MSCVIAGIVLHANIIALLIGKSGLPVLRVHVGIMDRNHVFELVVVRCFQ
jgi:hypothetical protein